MKFHCTYCGHEIESDSDPSGTLVTCPNCSAEISVPRLKTSSTPELSQSPETNSVASQPGPTWIRKCRRVCLFSLLGCFIFGAATAIFSLVSGDLGEFQIKILLTTLSLGVYSQTALCSAVLVDKGKFRVFGLLGIAASVTGVFFAILTNWELVRGWELLIKGRLFFLIVASSFAHSSLLLMINATTRLVRVSRYFTLGAIAAVAVLGAISTLDPDFLKGTWIILGIALVVNVLGTIATPLLYLATRETRSS